MTGRPVIAVNRGLLREVLRGLIACNSINPSLVPGAPGEAQIAPYVTTVCRDLGLESEIVEVAQGRPNVIATLRGEGGGRRLLLNGHLDTVAVELQDPAQSLSYIVIVLDEQDMPALDRDSSPIVGVPERDRRSDGQAHDELAPPARPLALDSNRSAV